MNETLPVVATLSSGVPERVTVERAAPTVLGGGRYRVLRPLGEGGFGQVYLAVDTRYGSQVAVKVLRGREPEALYRFKQEFRGLADLAHPNLVRLYELSAEEWFVVMELVDGVDLLTHFGLRHRAPPEVTAPEGVAVALNPSFHATPATDHAEVRRVFAQLAQGVAALHGDGKLHRDVKPSNVMVTRDGRAVLLDFGLVAEARPLGSLQGPRAGTPGYMAPEQRLGGELGPAADWYAFGASLIEVLTGDAAGLLGDADEVASRLDEVRCPADLAALCRRLVDADPARRPGDAEVLAAFGVHDAARPRADDSPIGRDDELRRLDAALDSSREGATLVRVEGESGIGKSALVDAWLRRATAADPSLRVLRGRCFEHEHIPFNAVDGVIDDLAAALLAEPATSLDAPPHLGDLAQMFPVLAGVDASGVFARVDASAADGPLRRDRALDALGALIRSTLAARRLVVCVDDTHWGDADSARLLTRLLRADFAGLLVVLVHRPARAPGGLLAAVDEWRAHRPPGVTEHVITLRPLDGDDALRLARRALARDDDALAARIAREADGNPFFIWRLAQDRAAAGDLHSDDDGLSGALRRQLGGGPAPMRRLVEVLSVAARPLAEDLATRAAGVDAAEVRATLDAAERARLVSSAVIDGRRCIETVHARVRDEVLRALDGATARTRHRALADAMIAADEREPEALLPHLLGADDRLGAFTAAEEAGARAERVFAFDRAAALYAVALELGVRPDARASLLTRRGEALADAGRSAAAAECLDEALAAGGAAMRDRLTVQRRCAELWLRSGYVDAGLRHFGEVLDAHGVAMPAAEGAAQRAALWRRLRFLARGMRFTERREDEVAPETLRRLDALWGAATSLGMLRPLVADAFALQHLLEALEAGEPMRVVRGLGFEASMETVLGVAFFDRRCDRMLAEMDRVVSRSGSDYMRAWLAMDRGLIAWFRGDFRLAWEACGEASRGFAALRQNAVWELAICDVFGLSAATYLGLVRELAAVVPDRHRAARDRGDLYATTNLAFYESFLLLTRDAPAEAVRCAEDSDEPFRHDQRLANRYGISYAIAQGHLYGGDAEAALAVIEREWRNWERVGMTRVQCARVEARYVRARAVIACEAAGASTDSRAARQRRRMLDDDLAALRRDRLPAAAPLLRGALAAVARRGDRDAEAEAHLRAAAEGFDRCGLALHAAAARHHLGALTQRAADVDAAARAHRDAAERGVARPEGMFHLALPGFSP